MYIDTLTRIVNAQRAGKEAVRLPCTRMDAAVVDLLVRTGYIKDAVKKGRGIKKIIVATLHGKENPIHEVSIVSKPSRRTYMGYQDLRPVKSGRGMAGVSTSRGIMSGVEARKRKLGGEVLFTIW